MRSEQKKNKSHKKQPQLLPQNPNWVQLQQILKIHRSKPSSISSNNSQNAARNSILGKRKERPDVESHDSESNPLTPTNDDVSMIIIETIALVEDILSNLSRAVLVYNGIPKYQLTQYLVESEDVTDVIAMDCEMVGVGQGNKSALGRVTLVNQWGNVLYDEFVRPIERVVDFRTQISGIRPRDLRKAKDFPAVQKKVAELIKGRILVGHALRNDLKALLLSHPKENLRDTSEYQPFLKERSRKALRHLAAEFLGVKIQNGEHCPVEDARAAMLLYQKNKKEWEKSVKDHMRLKRKQKKRGKRKKPVGGNATGAINTVSTS